MTLPPFAYERPADLEAAFAAVADGGVPYCGGTELLAAMGMGLLAPRRLVSLRAIDVLRGCTLGPDMLQLGSTMTHREIAGSAAVMAAAPLLASVAGRVGNIRVRSTGTVGGNLAFAEPRSDVATALMALGATVVVADSARRRRVPIGDFIVGPYETDLTPGELVLSVEIPLGVVDFTVYRKIVFTERPVVGVAIVRLRASGRWRIVVGAVGEQALLVEVGELGDVDAAGIAGDIDISPDLSGTETYKRHLVQVTIQRCLEEALVAVAAGA